MKIFVLNLVNRKQIYTITCLLLILVVLTSASIGVVTKIYSKDLIFVSAEGVPNNKIVILDAGHGGEDSGAVGVNGALEKDLNLQVALEIGSILEKEGYIVVYTRTDDRLLYTEEENIKGIRKISDLKNRCKFAEKYPESIFISIHMNSFGSKKYSGLQVYYTDSNDESYSLAQSIQNKVKNDLQNDNTRVITSGKNIYILENVQNTAVLIECGFLTNPEECEKLSKKDYQKELSFSIVCGIIEYIKK